MEELVRDTQDTIQGEVSGTGFMGINMSVKIYVDLLTWEFEFLGEQTKAIIRSANIHI